MLNVHQVLSKLENTDEDLTEERRRHEETRNQLETTKRQLEAAEKVLNCWSFLNVEPIDFYVVL